MPRQADALLIVSGRARDIRFAGRGGAPAQSKADLEGMDRRNRKRFETRFKRMADEGRLPQPFQFNELGDGIYEFKIDGWRMGTFLDGRSWCLTHLFPKKEGQGWIQKQISRASVIRAEHLRSPQ